MNISHYSHSLSDSLKVRIKLLLLNWNRTEIKVNSVALSRHQWLAYNKLLQKGKIIKKEVSTSIFFAVYLNEWMVMVLEYLLGAVFVITLFSNDFKTFVSDRFCKFQIFYCVLLIFFIFTYYHSRRKWW